MEKEEPDGPADDGLSDEAPSEADQCRAEIARYTQLYGEDDPVVKALQANLEARP